MTNRWKDEIFGGIPVCDNIVCRTCVLSLQDPQNCRCKVYTGETGIKPHDVYFYGGPCKYHRSQEDLKKAVAAQKVKLQETP